MEKAASRIARSMAGKICSPLRRTSTRLPATIPDSVCASTARANARSPTVTAGAMYCGGWEHPASATASSASATRISSALPACCESQRCDLDALPRRRALRDRVGKRHVAHAVLERGVRDLLAAANRVDELFLDAPADALLRGDRDLGERLVAAASAGEPLGLGLDAERALTAEDPRLRRRRERRERAEPQMRHGAAA